MSVSANDCIEWLGARNKNGYGVHPNSKGGGTRLAHRIAWEKVHGPILDGLHCLHKCDNPPCINVDHLFLGTPADNSADKIKKGRLRYGLPAHKNRGENQGSSKLKVSEVLEIREATGKYKDIANRFGIVYQTVFDIKHKRRWAWL